MEIVASSHDNMKPIERYKMCMDPSIMAIKTVPPEEVINVVKWFIYTEPMRDKPDEDMTVLTIMDDGGQVYATNSTTFRDDFSKICVLADNTLPIAVSVYRGTSKAGREFVGCRYIG